MEKFEKISFSLITFIVLIGLALAFYDRPWFESNYVVEDGFVEWLTVIALLSGAVVMFKRAINLKATKSKLFIMCLVGMGLVFLFGAGEEISWGQRIFGIKSPEFFMNHNSQYETNFHNLMFQGKSINRIIFGTGLGIMVAIYMLLMPYLFERKENIKNLINKFAIPVPKWSHVLFALFIFGLVSLTPSGKKGELREFGLCWTFFVLMYNPRNKLIYKE